PEAARAHPSHERVLGRSDHDAVRADPGDEERAEEVRHEDAGHRPRRDQRGVRAGADGVAQGDGLPARADQRQRRRDRAVASARRHRREADDHAAARARAHQQALRPANDVRRRRRRERDDHRKTLLELDSRLRGNDEHPMGFCNNRTIIVTGAGGGLGRAYAIALAAEGAKVVVNDIRADAAQAVVNEIGRSALANSDDITSMAGAARIVDAAVAKFGDVHGVVNNAGIVRDKMFASMSEEEWDLVIKVHLKGHFCITSTLVKRWRDQVKAGQKVDARIVNTSSGLNGSVGQSNYAAAKGGIASLTLVQAAELGRYGITANALAPAARTGMTEKVFADMMKKPEGGFDHYAPENVAPLVVWLCSPLSAGVTGKVFEVEGGKLSIATGWHTGPIIDKKARWKAEELSEAVAKLVDQSPKAQKVY